MRILFLTQVLPYPLVGGAKIRAYYMLRYLAQQHEVTLVSFVREDDRPEDVAHLQEFCRDVYTVPLSRSTHQNGAALLKSVWRGQPVVIARDEIQAMFALLGKLAQAAPFDVVHADQTAMAQYG
jgi:polysaccharide biosynthesis protein PslH